MITILKKWTILLAVVVMTGFPIHGCQWLQWRFSLKEEHEVEREEKTYSIDPSTLLRSLAYESGDSFILKSVTPEATTQWSNKPVPWKQADYYLIAQSFSQLVLNDSLDGWKLKEMFFNLDCEIVSTGFQRGGFRFFKSKQLNDKDSRVIRYIHILPDISEVYFAELVFYPELEAWETLVMAQTKISAESALQIAESVGGTAFRVKIDNECYIFSSIEAGGRYDGWWIRYSPRDGSADFKVIINALTGEYKIVR